MECHASKPNSEGKCDENNVWYCNDCWSIFNQAMAANSTQQQGADELLQAMNVIEANDNNETVMPDAELLDPLRFEMLDRVTVPGICNGTVLYVGNIHEKHESEIYAGIYLDQPKGKNSGSVDNKQYFQCPPNCGIFMNVSKLKKLTDVSIIY